MLGINPLPEIKIAVVRKETQNLASQWLFPQKLIMSNNKKNKLGILQQAYRSSCLFHLSENSTSLDMLPS